MSDVLARAVEVLRSGGLVAYPTDTVYGLGADGLSATAVARVFEAKGRGRGEPVPLLVDDLDSLEGIVEGLPTVAMALAEAFWPGALTIVMRASSAVPEAVTAGTGTVGVRVPGHDVPRAMARMLGRPLTGTSANRSGEPPCRTAAEVADRLGGMIDLVIDGECGQLDAASTVVDCSGKGLRIVREGAISSERVKAVAAAAGRAGR